MPNQNTMNRVSVDSLMPNGEQETLPMMALRGVVVFPHVMTHLDVGRDRSLNAINVAMETEDSRIFLAMQKNAAVDDPAAEDIYQMGCVAVIRQMLKLPGGTIRLLVEGLYRARLISCLTFDPYLLAEVQPLESVRGSDPIEEVAAERMLLERFEDFAKSGKQISAEIIANPCWRSLI